MADNDEFNENGDNENGDEGTEDFKNLRAKARKATAFEQENNSLKRENAFLKSGIPLDDPKMPYFIKGYEGDLEPEAIKAAAIAAGFITVAAPPVDPAVAQAEQAQQAVMAAATAGVPAFDQNAIDYAMDQAYEQGGLEGLSAVTQQYGVTFGVPPVNV